MQVGVQPTLLRWACERAGFASATCSKRFPRFEAWITGAAKPTLKQLERFASATYTPIGYFFLQAPPEERVPLPDFRVAPTREGARPSPNLLDTIYLCQQRQEWYRDFARTMGESPRSFVGSVALREPVDQAAAGIRRTLGFDVDARAEMRTWTDALRAFIDQADVAGIMVMCSGVVHNNTHRPLDPAEFGGFAVADPLAPLVFINGADFKARQIFTLAHELAHVWLGESSVSDAEALTVPHHKVESWCNRVAAEVLVPMAALRDAHDPRRSIEDEVPRLARRFKVSALVILRRLHDAGRMPQEQLAAAYDLELERLRGRPSTTGGNFYLSQAARVSRRFARAIIVSTWEGHSTFTEAFRLLGVKKMSTFREFGRSLGMEF